MLKEMFGTKETLEYDLGNCKLFETKYNGALCTKITYKSQSPSSFEIIKPIKHPNILPIYKITAHSIFTVKIKPFSHVFDKSNKKYNEYVILKLKNLLDFLHTQLKIQHNLISMDSLFVDEFGNILLGNFFNTTPFSSDQSDYQALDHLSINLIHKDLVSVQPFNSIFERLEHKNFYTELSIKEKKDFLIEIENEKNFLLNSIKINIFKIILQDLKDSNDKEYKNFALKTLSKIDSKLFQSLTKTLFSIIDSSVRMFLLMEMDVNSELDDVAEEISLGLQVKENALRFETINFIFKNEKCFNQKSFNYFITNIGLNVTDSETIGVICNKILELHRTDVDEGIYKLSMQFLYLNKSKMLVYNVIEQYFHRFNKYKIATELLPAMCSKLTDKDAQEACFVLLEKIFNFLKKHKNELPQKDWALKGLKSMFSNKKEFSVNERMAHLSKETSNEWEEEDAF